MKAGIVYIKRDLLVKMFFPKGTIIHRIEEDIGTLWGPVKFVVEHESLEDLKPENVIRVVELVEDDKGCRYFQFAQTY